MAEQIVYIPWGRIVAFATERVEDEGIEPIPTD